MKNNLKDYLDAVNVFSALQEEPAWMLELRQAALEKVEELPFPVIERVKYERWPLFNIDEENLNEGEARRQPNIQEQKDN